MNINARCAPQPRSTSPLLSHATRRTTQADAKLVVNDQFEDHFLTFIHCMYDHAPWVSHNRPASQIPIVHKIAALVRGKCNFSTFMSTLVDYYMIRLNLDILEVNMATMDRFHHLRPTYENEANIQYETASDVHLESSQVPITLIRLPDIDGKKRAGVVVNMPVMMNLLNNIVVMLYSLNKERVRILLTDNLQSRDPFVDVNISSNNNQTSNHSQADDTLKSATSSHKIVDSMDDPRYAMKCKLLHLFETKHDITHTDRDRECGQNPAFTQFSSNLPNTHNSANNKYDNNFTDDGYTDAAIFTITGYDKRESLGLSEKIRNEKVTAYIRTLHVYKLGTTNLFCIWNLLERVLLLDAWTSQPEQPTNIPSIEDDVTCAIRIDTLTTIKGPVTSNQAFKRKVSLNSTYNFTLP